MTLQNTAHRKYIYTFLCFIILALPMQLRAECQVTLEWDPNGAAPDGYRLFERGEDGEYSDYHHYDVGQESSCTVYGLEENTTYHFVVRAYAGAEESNDSNEATYKCTSGSSSNDPNPPSTPSTLSPEDTAMGVGLEPTLSASEFSDPDPEDQHAQTRWQIYRLDNDECIYDVVSNSDLTSIQVPPDVLEQFTTYYWKVSYYNQKGGISDPSPTNDFTTSNEIITSASSLGGGSSSVVGGSSDGLGVGCFIQSLY